MKTLACTFKHDFKRLYPACQDDVGVEEEGIKVLREQRHPMDFSY